MAAKATFVCQACGSEQRKWQGQCPDCHEWNCISEQAIEVKGFRNQTISLGQALTPQPITAISSQDAPRRQTHIDEFDRVLGGGLVQGSAILIGGDPGIGKSTLLLQASALLAQHHGMVLYITGEESARQVHLRGERIDALHENLQLVTSCDLEAMLSTIAKCKPHTVIIDSIQTTVTSQLSSAPGTVAQVRDCAAALIKSAKEFGHAVILVGHVTKDGSIAGPRVLEHMVDAVLYFEGDRGHNHRVLRAVKNRFGPAGEIGVFEMSDKGLTGIRDASRMFLAERAVDVPGSVVVACMEGTRPILVEIQALVAPTVYATPKRSTVGVDANRVGMLTAVLERRVGIPLGTQDIYVNVVGGVKLREPASDLGVVLAILSAFQEKALPANLVVFGEIGLTGELRPVSLPEARAKEALNLGFEQLLLPQGNFTRVQEANITATLRTTTQDVAWSTLAAKHLSDAVQMIYR
ncbi:MAG: DNA repair protein RadA [Mariprofundaceae bacterium]|nr:DNA repair protein RadA [Mariprofundaceae bacterium]